MIVNYTFSIQYKSHNKSKDIPHSGACEKDLPAQRHGEVLDGLLQPQGDDLVAGDFSRAIENKYAVQDANTGQFFKGTLRSGQVLDVETSIIVIGDVKVGAKVVSKGNVIILGTLEGTVYAGSTGNTNAFVIALDMNPMQIKIADVIAHSGLLS